MNLKSLEDFKKYSPLEISDSNISKAVSIEEESKGFNDWDLIAKDGEISEDNLNKLHKYADLKVKSSKHYF
jgi:hypothetical protein